jgi:hypothetical protein
VAVDVAYSFVVPVFVATSSVVSFENFFVVGIVVGIVVGGFEILHVSAVGGWVIVVFVCQIIAVVVVDF